MRKGEKAVFTIRSDYAYGAEGSGDKIPGPPPPPARLEIPPRPYPEYPWGVYLP